MEYFVLPLLYPIIFTNCYKCPTVTSCFQAVDLHGRWDPRRLRCRSHSDQQTVLDHVLSMRIMPVIIGTVELELPILSIFVEEH